MHVLLTNDDGISSPGILALGAALSEAGHRISVCAPDRERSAASHSVTLNAAMPARPVAFPGAARAWAVGGTPADCASLGLWLLRDDPVDMVISGINRGMNMGGACVYSGTVGAALEAAMCGTQALATSLCLERWEDEADYGPAARITVRVAEWAAKRPLPLGAIYNLNVPALPEGEIRGLAPATLAPIFLEKPNYEACEASGASGACEASGGIGYRYAGGTPNAPYAPNSDVALSRQGYATLTRLTWDFRLNADDAALGEIEPLINRAE